MCTFPLSPVQNDLKPPRRCEQREIVRKAIRINPSRFMSDFSYLTANRRFSLIFPNTRSLYVRFLYRSRSYSIGFRRFFLPGILLFAAHSRRKSSLSYPRYVTPYDRFDQCRSRHSVVLVPTAQKPFLYQPVRRYRKMKLRTYPRR